MLNRLNNEEKQSKKHALRCRTKFHRKKRLEIKTKIEKKNSKEAIKPTILHSLHESVLG